MIYPETFLQYLCPTELIDSDNKNVINYANKHTVDVSDNKLKAIKLYYAIRDDFRYDPYNVELTKNAIKASSLLTRTHGYCIEKANLLAACARVVGIPSRLGFAKVKNHIGTEKLEKLLKTNVLVFHGYTEFYINSKWVKATPAFNIELCQKLNVTPLDFDGENDSVFQQYDKNGGMYMEYIHDYGQFADLPFDLFISELKINYPHLFMENTNKLF
jgi:transglutaminase-like putative cysteine protease